METVGQAVPRSEYAATVEHVGSFCSQSTSTYIAGRRQGARESYRVLCPLASSTGLPNLSQPVGRDQRKTGPVDPGVETQTSKPPKRQSDTPAASSAGSTLGRIPR
jgi:hypothetical protein